MHKIKKNKLTFSSVFTLFILVLNAVNYAFGGWLYSHFALFTDKFYSDLEFWRLVSYPFVDSSIEDILLFATIFSFVSPKLELFFGRKFYSLFLFLISIVLGAIATLIFHNYQINFGGLEGMSLFIFTLFAMLLVRDKIVKAVQPALTIGSSAIFFWGVVKFYLANFFGINFILPSLVICAIGIVFGLIIYTQIHFIIKSRLKKVKEKMKTIRKIYVSNNEDLNSKIYTSQKFQDFFSNIIVDSAFVKTKLEEKIATPENYSTQDNEEKLNSILDKILVEGKDSLTNEEMNFLNSYSN